MVSLCHSVSSATPSHTASKLIAVAPGHGALKGLKGVAQHVPHGTCSVGALSSEVLQWIQAESLRDEGCTHTQLRQRNGELSAYCLLLTGCSAFILTLPA